MDEPTKSTLLGNYPAFKVLLDETKSPPTLRRPTADEVFSIVDGRARQQGFLLIAELLGRLIFGTWDKVKASLRKASDTDRT